MNAHLLKLHLGCFDQVLNGWINTDITPHIFLSKIPGIAFLFLKIGVLSEQRYEQYNQGMFHDIRYQNLAEDHGRKPVGESVPLKQMKEIV